MKLYSFLIVAILITLFVACANKKQVANPGDYSAFLKPGIIHREVDNVRKQISFWEYRLQKDTGNFVDMLELGYCHLHLFKLRGTVANLHLGDSLLKRSSAKLQNTDPDILFALSQNSITQHKFKVAAFFTETAGTAGGDLYKKRLLEFDTKMELGELMMATGKIESLKDKSSFDYLVRRSKLEDQKGNLTMAIQLMEQAFEKIKNGRGALYCWTLSNLGDMYGHAGRIEDSYDAYLKVLQKDGSYVYALKGIAWIAYSHDHNSKEARRIYQYILSQTNMPDIYLALADIEEWEGNSKKKNDHILQFLQLVETTEYGKMYTKYLIQLYTDDIKDLEKALVLAEKEITYRATPETYDWLAWIYFVKGDKQQAYTIANNYVYKRNFEPGALFHTALIFLGAGKKNKAKKMLDECLTSEFEIGPVKTRFIQQQRFRL